MIHFDAIEQGPTPKVVAQAPGSDYTFVLLYSSFDTWINVYEHTKNFRQVYSSGSIEKSILIFFAAFITFNFIKRPRI